MSTQKRYPRIVIAGRPNVGKSTLLNRLVGQKVALVADTPGVTRDSRFSKIQMGDQMCELVDTAGIEFSDETLVTRLNNSAENAIKTADVILFMIDGRDGVTPIDAEIINRLRTYNKPIVAAVNKADVKGAEDVLYETYALGLEASVSISAEHGSGLYELGEALEPFLEYQTVNIDETAPQPLPICIVGKPNAGKSTLVNHLLKTERMLTGPEAGLTREAVGSLWEYNGQLIELVDTPGVRRKGKVTQDLEQMSVTNAMAAIARSEAVVLLMDATHPYEKQDAILASHVVEKGKPLVIALNKWDIAEEKDEIIADMKHKLEHSFSQVKGVPMVTFSAKTGKGIDKLLPALMDIHQKWQTKLTTSQLNDFLEGMQAENPPPMRSGRRLKLKYMTQIGNEPPTFALFSNMPEAVPSFYLRYLTNGMREAFDLYGVPLEIIPRGSKNPYVNQE